MLSEVVAEPLISEVVAVPLLSEVVTEPLLSGVMFTITSARRHGTNIESDQLTFAAVKHAVRYRAVVVVHALRKSQS